LYLTAETKQRKLTKEQKEENGKTLALAAAVKSNRLLQIKNEEFGFRNDELAKSNFITYVEKSTTKKKNSIESENWITGI